MNYLAYGVPVASEIPLPGARQIRRTGRIRIERGPSLDPSPFRAFHNRHVPGAGRRPWLSIGRSDGGYRLRFPGLADFELSASGDRIVCRPRPRLAPSTLGHLVLDHVLPLAIGSSGALALHASAVHVPGLGTIGFVGPAGSGKSTLAAALGVSGCTVVTDDCLVVDVEPACVAVPGYPGLRLWRDAARNVGITAAGPRVAHYTLKRRWQGRALRFRSTRSPLVAIFVLGSRRRTKLPTRTKPLASGERLVSLVSSAYTIDVEDRQQLTRIFRALSSLAARVPVVRLELRDSAREVVRAAAEVLLYARTLRRAALTNRPPVKQLPAPSLSNGSRDS